LGYYKDLPFTGALLNRRGFAVLFGPTGGYILVVLTIIASALGNAIIYAFGLPFLPGDLMNLRVIPFKI
jgi:Tat (twin-arginine translocation) pathway signal sequence